jgi:hypothetical protein
MQKAFALLKVNPNRHGTKLVRFLAMDFLLGHFSLPCQPLDGRDLAARKDPLKTNDALGCRDAPRCWCERQIACFRSSGSPAGEPKALAVLLTRHSPILLIEWRAFDRQIEVRQVPTHRIGPIGAGQHLRQFDKGRP